MGGTTAFDPMIRCGALACVPLREPRRVSARIESDSGLSHDAAVRGVRAAGLVLFLLGLSPQATAAGLDIGAWLARPGVRLVAVEFYATWCEPCMKAVPQWKALHERYRREGLRLIVVSTRDTSGSCTNPGWNPDDIVCDDDGFLADRFGASSLPAAYLWSWQGDLLVKQGHVDAVEAKIEAWAPTAPRVDVEAGDLAPGAGVRKAELADLVRTALRQDDKLVVVATAQERARLDQLRKQSFNARYDDAMQCTLGKELSANGLLRVKISGRKGRQSLHLQLLSAERGCLVAAARVGWNFDKPTVSVAEAVRELMQALQKQVVMPWTAAGGKVVRADAAPDSPYAQMAQELASADRQKQARAQELERAWSVVSRFAGSPSIDTPRRITAVEQFLRDFPTENPRRAEAQTLLASLRPAPKPIAQVMPARAPVAPAPRRRPDDMRPEGAPSVALKPAGDRDGDGIPDERDLCPEAAEDRDAFEDHDGCPELDNDRDGIPDREDKCPNEPETKNGFEDEDGCADEVKATSSISRIQPSGPILFATGSGRLLAQSFGVLDEIADVLKRNTRLRVRVEGHTDSYGSSEANYKLSQARAASVRDYLVNKGVAAGRLVAQGFGEDRPIASNRTAQGRTMNRRMEFVVLGS